MQPPKLPTIFKSRSAKPFEYKPLYYNEQKDRLDKIRAKYKDEPKKVDKESMRLRIQEEWKSHKVSGSSEFDKSIGGEWNKSRQGAVHSSNRKLLYIILSLVAITYLILTY